MRLSVILLIIILLSCTESGKKFSLATLEEDIAAFSPEDQEKLKAFAHSYDNFGFRLDSLMGVPVAEVKNSTYTEILNFMKKEEQRASDSDSAYLSGLLEKASGHKILKLPDSSSLYYLKVHQNYLKENNLDLIHGRMFDPSADTSEHTAIISVKAAKTFGVTKAWNIEGLPNSLQIIGTFETRRRPPYAKLPKMVLVVAKE